MRTISFTSLLFVLLLTACGGDQAADTSMTEDSDAPDRSEMASNTPMIDGVTVVEMPQTAAFPDAKINNITYNNGTFDYDVSGYFFGAQTPDADQLMCANSDKGQHIHLIIDNEPYLAKYEATFKEDIEDGEHYMLTFLSRSYHQSIKNNQAARVAKVTAQGGTFTSMKNMETPMLFYSRPKGTYRGKKETENIMLDFYPVNASMGDGYQVKAELNGQMLKTFSDWKSYYIKGLKMGEHTLKLTLLDKDGNVVDAPLNPVSRTFTLEDLPTGE